ncbi:hypothetical protein ACSAZL_15785 [Methanosarcina sp. T3]
MLRERNNNEQSNFRTGGVPARQGGCCHRCCPRDRLRYGYHLCPRGGERA